MKEARAEGSASATTQTEVDLSHVFVCYGAHSFDAALRIVEQLPQPGAHCFFFLLFAADTSQVPQGAHYSLAPSLLRENNLTKPFVIARWFSGALKEFNKHSPRRIVAYLPHPFELPGNHFMYHDPRVTRLELLPDGLMNYLDRPVVPESKRKKAGYVTRSALRALAAKATGLSYRPLIRGHLTQFREGHYQKSWTFNPQGFLTRGGELVQLPPRQRPAPETKAPGFGLLILDQEISHLVTTELENNIRRKLRALVRAEGAPRVFYKAHPRGKNRAQEWNDRGIAVKDLSALGQAEDVLLQHGISTLVGFFSTPLLLSAEEVQVRMAVLPTPGTPGIRQKKLVAELREVLRASGAQIIAP